jgi:hypothetical protein
MKKDDNNYNDCNKVEKVNKVNKVNEVDKVDNNNTLKSLNVKMIHFYLYKISNI